MNARHAVGALALVTLALTTFPAAAKERNSSTAQLSQDIIAFFSNRDLFTLVPLPTTATDVLSDHYVERPVYTVVESNGRVHYLMPGGAPGGFVAFPEPVSLGQCNGAIAVGRTIEVATFDIDAGRIEFSVMDMQTGTRVGVRIKMDERGTAGASIGDVIAGFRHIVSLGPEWAEAEKLDGAWQALEQDVQAAEAAWTAASAATFEERRAVGSRRVRALESSLSNREECERLKKWECSETRSTRDSLDRARQELTGLDGEERASQIVALRSRVTQAATASATDLSIIEDKSRDMPEREAAFTRASASIADQTRLIDEIAALEGDVSEQRSALATQQLSLDVAGADIAERQKSLRHEDRARGWQRMTAEAAAFRAKAESGSASPADRDKALTSWSNLVARRRTLLGEMSSDGQAQPDGAGGQLDAEATAIDKARHALAGQRAAARLADLDVAFGKLESERTLAFSRYGPAFKTDEQSARARDLLTVLQHMAENRREAASLGSTAASARINSIQTEINQLRQLNPGL